jgi:hypothetical protein
MFPSLIQGSMLPLFAYMFMPVYSDLLVSSFVSLFDLYNYIHLIKKKKTLTIVLILIDCVCIIFCLI